MERLMASIFAEAYRTFASLPPPQVRRVGEIIADVHRFQDASESMTRGKEHEAALDALAQILFPDKPYEE